jgi:hypothetical protein
VAPVNEAALTRARQSWRAAEARLYPLAMTNVDGYQRALVLVAAVCERLRAGTLRANDLLACQADSAEYVASACDATGTSAQGLDIDDLFGSAAAARDRELAADERRLTRLTAIEHARAAGSEWTDLYVDELGPRVPALRIQVDTGWAILTAIGADETTGTPVLLVSTVRVDPTTGELRDQPDNDVRTVTDADEWERVARALQADLP